METVDITAVLVVRNQADELPKILAHLEQQSYPAGRFEILAIDRGSTDGTPEILARHSEGSAVKLRQIPTTALTAPGARNIALQESRGHWILFLDSELLASPKLIEAHVRAQDQHGGSCCIAGLVERHPQAEHRARLREFSSSERIRFADNQPLRFLDWRCWNLSVPRTALQQVGGFDESLTAPGLEDVELAWRLEESGLQGFHCEHAVAYCWQPLDVDEEFARRYAEGFALRQVLDKTRSEVLANRYLGPGTLVWAASDVVLAPVFQRVCLSMSNHARPFDWACRHMTRGAVIRGYRDASRGRPPRHHGVSLS